MRWFQGTVVDAINKTKNEELILVVYISGNDDVSKDMENTWQDSSVSNFFDKSQAVCLRFDANSDACKQFSEMYPVVCVPCVYFIGTNEVPIEVVGGFMSAETFKGKAETVIRPQQSSGDGSSSTLAEENKTEQAEANTSSPAGGKDEGEPDGMSLQESTSIEERVEIAKTKLAERQAKKRGEAKEKEKKEEQERRSSGRGILNAPFTVSQGVFVN